jgi:hypothetical protein
MGHEAGENLANSTFPLARGVCHPDRLATARRPQPIKVSIDTLTQVDNNKSLTSNHSIHHRRLLASATAATSSRDTNRNPCARGLRYGTMTVDTRH